MILALAARHKVERPSISMEGGTLILWSGLAHRRLFLPLKKTLRDIKESAQCQVRISLHNIKKILLTVRSISEPLPKVSCKFAFGSGSLYPLCANRLYVELEG